MTDIRTFTELKSKMVLFLPLEPWLFEFEVQKNYSLVLITEIFYLKQNILK